ncbi:MAG: hypothetical protein JEZ03_10095 [Bacteroidales bacterium]|nr:hypothetical protein [Bacteroidales bacterium]
MKIFKFSKQSRRVMLIMALLSFAAVMFAWFFYAEVNRAEDPRVLDVKQMYVRYSQQLEKEDYGHMLLILDSIKEIYDQVDHYTNSYEQGVVLNNKAAIYLTLALHHTKDSIEKMEYINIAQGFSLKGIELYNKWYHVYGSLDESEIQSIIEPSFRADDFMCSDKQAVKYLRKRVKDIREAQYENDRRLSVSYTNLGITQRHYKQYDLAAESYIRAIEFWGENLSAKNNLNLLEGKPLEKRSIIKKLFPPDKKGQTN